jgi:hypothetical protein
MSSTTLNPPPPTPVRGTRIVVADLVRELNDALPPKPRPLVDRFHADCCAVCTVKGGNSAVDTARLFAGHLADAVAAEVDDPAVTFEDPPLTQGQKRVFEGERARLFRMLDARTPAKDAAVLEWLDDMAGQAPAVDQVIAEEAQRRRDTADARPTVALALRRNRDRS